MRPKILIFSLVYYPEYVGGAELAIKNITDRTDAASFDMVTLQGSEKEKFSHIGNISVYRVGWQTRNMLCFKFQKIIFPFLAFWKAKRLHKKNNYSTVWSMMANQAGFAGLFFKKKFKAVHFLLTLQEGDPIPEIRRKTRFVKSWFSQIFTQADQVTAISEYLKKFAQSMNAKNVLVIPNGVDLKTFANKQTEESVIKLRKELGISSDAKILVTTSRLVKKNGLSDVVSILPTLPADVVFLILGIGELKEEIIIQARDLGVLDRVIFAGYVEYENIPKYFALSDVFVRPSLSEGLGNSFLEAMYFGLPTVGTNVGGIQDFLFDEETGFVCRPQDLHSLKSAIERAFDHGSDVVPAAQMLVEGRFNWDVISNTFNALWK
jgi:glycosyltransferase involved in cell wall biosynthesis